MDRPHISGIKVNWAVDLMIWQPPKKQKPGRPKMRWNDIVTPPGDSSVWRFVEKAFFQQGAESGWRLK